MSLRVGAASTGTDRAVLGVATAAVALAAAGMLWLVLTAVGGRVEHRTVRVDNRAGLAVQVDAVDAGGARLGLGQVGPRAAATFQEVADLGAAWTFVVSYGGEEVWRQPVSGRELAARGWTVQVPASATAALERRGYR